MSFYVYMLSSKPNGTIYIGMTNDLIRRTWEHKSHSIKGFTQKYDVSRLVWFEQHPSAESAIKRENQLKKYKRNWKIELIEKCNPHWDDVFETIANS